MNRRILAISTATLLSLTATIACDTKPNPPSTSSTLSPEVSNLLAVSGYTPYDALAMTWSREKGRSIVWSASGGQSGKLLVSKGSDNQRPDWGLMTQGVVSGLSARGEKVVIIATAYTDSDGIRPVFRKPRKPLAGGRSLFIPLSSIEFAFDRLLERENVQREDIKIPKAENVAFPTIASLLLKPADDKDAIDFGILVEPFITNVISQNPDKYELGSGGLYESHYSVVVRAEDLKQNRAKYIELLKQLLEADKKMAAFPDDATFYREVWGREKDGKPELLPKTLTFKRSAAKLQLQPTRLRQLLKEELTYLTQKYPDQLKMPDNIDTLVDPSLLQEVAPDRVTN
jgi:ABC-type nitrate/sulfonate/bicarbonate transport system substrate-binding protein